ncbi:hypothetical protein BB560_002822 [Smittium megazygosporum]|uniref:FACT complex subunit POB3 n=1 Tax=Smittium megazygosporum TaxID=133381 RepID=A0A2T9ZDU7_9FUNG|nr:hypothetical protein BB560_002822 [Smittium megazygosporum]
MSEVRSSFVNINLASDPYLNAKGELRLGQSGLGWKPDSELDASTAKSLNRDFINPTSGLLAIQASEISSLTWQRCARGYGLIINLKNGSTHRLDGFEQDAFQELKSAINKYFHGVTLEVRDTSVKGHNWGKTEFEGTNLFFKVENKSMFDIPMETVSNTNLAGKTEVSIEFQQAKTNPSLKRKNYPDELVEIRFYVPGTVSKESDSRDKDKDDEGDDGEQVEGEQEVSAAQLFYETVKSKADLGHITAKSIVTFNEILCLTPRGRYTIDMFKDFLRLRGKTYDYKILYEHIYKLFMVTKPDGLHVLFVVCLSPPIRQGQTRYPYLVFQFLKDEEKEINLNLKQPDLDPSVTSRLLKRYEEPLYKTVTELFTVLSGKQLGIPDDFTTVQGANGAKCSFKANEGLLYPLSHGLLFVPKPTQYIEYKEISSIVFSRVGSTSASSGRTFDIIVHTFSSTDTQFSNILREEYQNLLEYFRENNVKVITDNPIEQKPIYDYSSDSLSESDYEADKKSKSRSKLPSSIANKPSGGFDNHGDSEEESEDEDFIAQSESDVGEEFDENYQSSGEED